MTTSKDGGPAFPIPEDMHNLRTNGMTLRDYFAAKAMQGLLAGDERVNYLYVAEDAYNIADAMLKARNS